MCKTHEHSFVVLYPENACNFPFRQPNEHLNTPYQILYNFINTLMSVPGVSSCHSVHVFPVFWLLEILHHRIYRSKKLTKLQNLCFLFAQRAVPGPFLKTANKSVKEQTQAKTSNKLQKRPFWKF